MNSGWEDAVGKGEEEGEGQAKDTCAASAKFLIKIFVLSLCVLN